MTHREGDRAMCQQAAVVYRGLEYQRISGLIYRRDPESDGIIVRGELLSSCGRSVSIARLDLVDWLCSKEKKRSIRELDPEELEHTPQEIRAKEAFLAGEELLYQGERWKTTAMILRKWMERVYWMSLELSRISDCKVQEVWTGEPLLFPKPED